MQIGKQKVPWIDATVGIDYAHHEIHEGNSYTICDTLACNNTTVKWMIITPNTPTYCHLLFDLSCTGEALYLVTGDADRDIGTPLSVLNRKRVGVPNVAGLTASRTPSGGTTDGGTVLFSKRSGITGLGSKNIEGSVGRDSNEWILKPNTKYIISITTYTDSHATCKLDWYEEEDGENVDDE